MIAAVVIDGIVIDRSLYEKKNLLPYSVLGRVCFF